MKCVNVTGRGFWLSWWVIKFERSRKGKVGWVVVEAGLKLGGYEKML